MKEDIYLIRHGETHWNLEGRYQGQLNSSLTELGREQAHQLGKRLVKIFSQHTAPSLLVSPLGRTRETAEILSSYNVLQSPRFDDRLKEVSVGSWDGLSHREIEEKWPGALRNTDSFDWYFHSPDGERYDEVVARVTDLLDELKGPAVIVSHGLLGRILRGVYLNLPVRETLSLPVPQNVIWHMSAEGVQKIEA